MPKQYLLSILIGVTCNTAFAFGEARGVDGFKVIDPSHYQVFSQRGIGSFNIMAAHDTPYSVCFYYRDQQRFEKLEGVTIRVMTTNGDKHLKNFNINRGCVEFRFDERDSLPLQIEFVDVYR